MTARARPAPSAPFAPGPALVLGALLLLSGCAGVAPSGAANTAGDRSAPPQMPFDSQSLGDIMLSVGGADEAVAFFRDALAADPDNDALRHGLARALGRNRAHAEARLIWAGLDGRGALEPRDRIDYAVSLAHLGQWEAAEAQLAQLPPGADSARAAMAAGLIADQRADWGAADAAYARARALSAQPAGPLNNWGVSLMARGDFAAAEARFEEALSYEPNLFSAKNNLTLAYGLQRRYRLPLVPLTEEERAILLHNLGVVALRRGDVEVGRTLLEQSLAAHPQHYAPAADKLSALGRTS